MFTRFLSVAALGLALVGGNAMAASLSGAAGVAGADVSAKLGASLSGSLNSQSQAGNNFSFGSSTPKAFSLDSNGSATNAITPLSTGGLNNVSTFNSHFAGNTGGLNVYNGVNSVFAEGTVTGKASLSANLDANVAAFGEGAELTAPLAAFQE